MGRELADRIVFLVISPNLNELLLIKGPDNVWGLPRYYIKPFDESSQGRKFRQAIKILLNILDATIPGSRVNFLTMVEKEGFKTAVYSIELTAEEIAHVRNNPTYRTLESRLFAPDSLENMSDLSYVDRKLIANLPR
jgi:hypothetical protein